jgi:hypothetical protein
MEVTAAILKGSCLWVDIWGACKVLPEDLVPGEEIKFILSGGRVVCSSIACPVLTP